MGGQRGEAQFNPFGHLHNREGSGVGLRLFGWQGANPQNWIGARDHRRIGWNGNAMGAVGLGNHIEKHGFIFCPGIFQHRFHAHGQGAPIGINRLGKKLAWSPANHPCRPVDHQADWLIVDLLPGFGHSLGVFAGKVLFGSWEIGQGLVQGCLAGR